MAVNVIELCMIIGYCYDISSVIVVCVNPFASKLQIDSIIKGQGLSPIYYSSACISMLKVEIPYSF